MTEMISTHFFPGRFWRGVSVDLFRRVFFAGNQGGQGNHDRMRHSVSHGKTADQHRDPIDIRKEEKQTANNALLFRGGFSRCLIQNFQLCDAFPQRASPEDQLPEDKAGGEGQHCQKHQKQNRPAVIGGRSLPDEIKPRCQKACGHTNGKPVHKPSKDALKLRIASVADLYLLEMLVPFVDLLHYLGIQRGILYEMPCHQLLGTNAQDLRQAEQHLRARLGASVFPFGNRRRGNSQHPRQLCLGHVLLFP